MAIRLSDVFPRGELRYEPIDKWVRCERGGETVVVVGHQPDIGEIVGELTGAAPDRVAPASVIALDL